LSDDFLRRFNLGGSFEAEPLKISRQRTHLLAYDRIRIIAAFSSGKVVAKLENCLVFLTGYAC